MDSWGSGGGGIIGTSATTDESGVADCYDPFADMGGEAGSGSCYTSCMNSYKQDCWEKGKAEFDRNLTNYVLTGCGTTGAIGAIVGTPIFGGVMGCGVGAIIGFIGAYQGGGATERTCLIEKRGHCREYCVGKTSYP